MILPGVSKQKAFSCYERLVKKSIGVSLEYGLMLHGDQTDT